MKKSKSSFAQKVLVGVFCAIFLIVSAIPVLGAPKKPKKDKTDTPVASEEPAAGDVDVYAEGAYTTGAEGDLAVYIYADINVDDLCSYGVKLAYDDSKLESPDAEKNEAEWYMGTTEDKKPYMNPDTSTSGEIIFIGGRLDEATPTAGVTGTRVLLGKVTFSRLDDDPVVDPDSYFGIALELGRASPYDNFVTTGGDVKDVGGLSFTTLTIRERGDANADGLISAHDILTLRQNLSNSTAPVYMDCNADGIISAFDILCVRQKI